MTKNSLNKKDILYFLSFGVLCLSIFIFGLVFVLTSDVKGMQNDANRINDFENIRYNIQNFISSEKRFPNNLTELDNSSYGTKTSYYYSSTGATTNKSLYKDPKTNELYGYEVASDNKSFKLCTTFEVGSEKIKNSQHTFSKGYDCIKFNVEQYYYDLIKK